MVLNNANLWDVSTFHFCDSNNFTYLTELSGVSVSLYIVTFLSSLNSPLGPWFL